MPSYFIGNVADVGDPAKMAEYRVKVSRTLELYDGSFVVRGGKFTVLEGDWLPRHLSIMRFPSAEHARRWYTSPEYGEIVPLRAGTHMDLVLLEGNDE